MKRKKKEGPISVSVPKSLEYQSVIVTLSDGRKGYFTGPAMVDQSDVDRGVTATFQFTIPQPMVPGMSFGRIDGKDEET